MYEMSRDRSTVNHYYLTVKLHIFNFQLCTLSQSVCAIQIVTENTKNFQEAMNLYK